MAEHVEKVNPDLVARDEQGQALQETEIARQQKEIQSLTAAVKTQAAELQKVTDQLKTQISAPRFVVAND